MKFTSTVASNSTCEPILNLCFWISFFITNNFFFRSDAIEKRIFTSSWWVCEKCWQLAATARRNCIYDIIFLLHSHTLSLCLLSFPSSAVPPMIVEGSTSNDMVVREGSNVTLVCKAKGYPEPYVRKFIGVPFFIVLIFPFFPSTVHVRLLFSVIFGNSVASFFLLMKWKIDYSGNRCALHENTVTII